MQEGFMFMLGCADRHRWCVHFAGVPQGRPRQMGVCKRGLPAGRAGPHGGRVHSCTHLSATLAFALHWLVLQLRITGLMNQGLPLHFVQASSAGSPPPAPPPPPTSTTSSSTPTRRSSSTRLMEWQQATRSPLQARLAGPVGPGPSLGCPHPNPLTSQPAGLVGPLMVWARWTPSSRSRSSLEWPPQAWAEAWASLAGRVGG